MDVTLGCQEKKEKAGRMDGRRGAERKEESKGRRREERWNRREEGLLSP